MKFLEKPEAQSDLPLASHEKSGEDEGTLAPPSIPRPEPCAWKASQDFTSLQSDTAHTDTAMAPSLSHMGEGEKYKEQGKEMKSVNNENSSKNEGMILEDNETRLDNGWRLKEGIRNYSVPSVWGTPRRKVWARPRSPTDSTWRRKISLPSNAEAPQPVTGANTENAENKIDISPTLEDVQHVRTVRVPANQISEQEFVKIERKRRKNKEYQTDCKAS